MGMANNFEIIDQSFHENGNSEPFVAAIVDDTQSGDTKLVIMFEDSGYTAVLSLDKLIESEDISEAWNADRYERGLRDDLWEYEELDDN